MLFVDNVYAFDSLMDWMDRIYSSGIQPVVSCDEKLEVQVIFFFFYRWNLLWIHLRLKDKFFVDTSLCIR
jgi:hypothetical protein